MTNTTDVLGPVDWLVVEFPADKANFSGEMADELAEEDILAVGEALEPGSIAAVLVWENTWAGPFAGSVRRSGGQLIDSGRIPTQALLGAIEAENPQPITRGV